MALMASTGTQNKKCTALKQIGNQSQNHLPAFTFHLYGCWCCSCSNFDPSLALKLAPVCQEALEAEHAGLLLVGQAQHCSSKTYVGLKFYSVAILVFWWFWIHNVPISQVLIDSGLIGFWNQNKNNKMWERKSQGCGKEDKPQGFEWRGGEGGGGAVLGRM